MRRLLVLLAVIGAAFAAAGPATAADELADARAEVEQTRALTEQAVEIARGGDRDRAYTVARNAYLDHFELLEIPLRLRDPNLVLDLEFEFAELRNRIRDGAPIGEVSASARRIEEGLDDVERALAEEGFAAPALAFGFSFSILFREGVEAVLLIAILLRSLQAGRASNYRKPLAWGVAAAIGATAVTWVLAAVVIEIAPLERELLEGITAAAAVVVLFAVTFWLVARLEQRHWAEFMRSRVSSALAVGSSLAFAGLGFTAVYREGFETVLFYQALLLFGKGLELWIVLGVVVAAVALAAVGYAILRLGKRLPLKPMLVTGASILLLLSVAFAGNAVRALQEGDWIPVTPIDGDWARLPLFVAELTGIHPTREGMAVQGALLVVYALGAAYMFAWKPLRRRISSEPART